MSSRVIFHCRNVTAGTCHDFPQLSSFSGPLFFFSAPFPRLPLDPMAFLCHPQHIFISRAIFLVSRGFFGTSVTLSAYLGW